MFSTKNVSNNATGKGKTSMATSAIIPKGKKEFTKLGNIRFMPAVLTFSILPSEFKRQNFENYPTVFIYFYCISGMKLFKPNVRKHNLCQSQILNNTLSV